MATPSAYAKSAVLALSQVLPLPPGGSDAESASIIIDEAIRLAARATRRELKETRARAQVRLAQLLNACPAVIYSFKAHDDFAATFVSDSIAGVFG